MGILKKQREILEIKTTVAEMKNTFGGLNNRLAEERMYELEDISMGTLKTKKKKKDE